MICIFSQRHLIYRVSISLEVIVMKRILGLLLMMGMMVGCGKGIKVGKEEYPNGVVEVEYQHYTSFFFYKTKHGWYKSYYGSGKLAREGNYKDGEKDGKWIYYDGDGKLAREGNYKDGEKDGRLVRYYKSGTISGEANHKDGEKDGKWVYYNEDGKIEREENFKDGMLVSNKRLWYHMDGKIKKEASYKQS